MNLPGMHREAAVLVAPAIGVLAAVALLPMLYVIWMSLQDASVFRTGGFAGLTNYARLISDFRFWNALANTAYFAAVSVALELALGLAIAVAIVRAGRARAMVYGILLVPWVVPTVVSARMWEWIYDAELGVLNRLLGARVNWLGDPFTALNAAVVMDVWKSTPFVALLLVAGLQGIPRDLYRAAALDGAGVWTTFRRVTLPLVTPVLLVCAIFRTIDALRVFDAVYVLTGGGPANGTETLSIYAYKLLFQALEFSQGAAASVVILVLTGGVTLAYARALRGGLV